MRRRSAIALEICEAVLIALVLATFAKTFVVQAYQIPSGSMEQNLLIGDHILVNKFIYGPSPSILEQALLPVRPIKRGDVVVFRFPEDPQRDFIKRCVGLPGDRVELVDKALVVNGRPVDDTSYTYRVDPRTYPSSRFLPEAQRFRDNFGPYSVPANGYFFLGDNRDNSNDSRAWQSVPNQLIRGRAFMIYWSFEPEEQANPSESEGGFQWSDLSVMFREIRWDRIFSIVR
ncbi:MAG: signal peptidase I [Acidobacteriota bacterium]